VSRRIPSCKPSPATDARAPNFIRGDYLLPALLLKDEALRHNIELMANWCDRHGLSLAPHGKTTMAPRLVKRQLDAGAWAVTAATTGQARVFRSNGIPTILLANELVEPTAIRWVADELTADPTCRIICLADSLAGVAIMNEAAQALSVLRPIEVLVELGFSGGRTGCRTIEDALTVAAAVVAAPTLRLAGVECYEGGISEHSLAATVARVDELLASLRRLAEMLDASHAFDDCEEIIVSAGGSIFFDRVAGVLGGAWALTRPVRLVLRSGCYLTHDSGVYSRLSPFDGRAMDAARLRPALEAWGAVLSLPEPGLAIVGFGKRDVPYDHDLPIPQRLRRRDGTVVAVPPNMQIADVNDQHAYLRGDCSAMAVGDWIGCGISHPCTAFDKWRQILLVDESYAVLDVIETVF
jgi:D-serine deaminase-like pyridoxal phosphate-dependent protein